MQSWSDSPSMTRHASSLVCSSSSSSRAAAGDLTSRVSAVQPDRRRTLGDLMDVLAARDELAGDGDAGGRLHLVAGEDPAADAGVAEELERRLDVVLQLVLDARYAEELEIGLEVTRHDRRHRLGPIVQAHPRRLVLAHERRIGLLGQPLAPDDERAQTLARHVPALLLEPVIRLHDRGHDHVGTLLVEDELAGRPIAHDERHALRLGREGEDLKHIERQRRAVGRPQLHRRPIARRQRQPDRLGEANNRNLVRRGRLIRHRAVVVLDRGDVVTERERHGHVFDARRHVSPTAIREHGAGHELAPLAEL